MIRDSGIVRLAPGDRLDGALEYLKRQLDAAGVLREVRSRVSGFMPAGQRRRRKSARARARHKRLLAWRETKARVARPPRPSSAPR